MPPTPTMVKIDPEEPAPAQQDYVINREISFVGKNSYDDFFGDYYEQQLELDNLLLWIMIVNIILISWTILFF